MLFDQCGARSGSPQLRVVMGNEQEEKEGEREEEMEKVKPQVIQQYSSTDTV